MTDRVARLQGKRRDIETVLAALRELPASAERDRRVVFLTEQWARLGIEIEQAQDNAARPSVTIWGDLNWFNAVR